MLSMLGVLDASSLLLAEPTFFAQIFSIAEVLWLPVCVLFVLVARRRGVDASLGWLYVVYQLALLVAGLVLLQQAEMGQGIVPPTWLLLAALVFYSAFFILAMRQYLSVK
jgi:hypothetical protein